MLEFQGSPFLLQVMNYCRLIIQSKWIRTSLQTSLRVSRQRALPLRSLLRIIWHTTSSCNTAHCHRKALPTTLAWRVRLNHFQTHRRLPKHPPIQAPLKCVVDAEEIMKIAGIVHVGSASSAADAVEDRPRMVSALRSGTHNCSGHSPNYEVDCIWACSSQTARELQVHCSVPGHEFLGTRSILRANGKRDNLSVCGRLQLPLQQNSAAYSPMPKGVDLHSSVTRARRYPRGHVSLVWLNRS